jgi:hypothetical protein
VTLRCRLDGLLLPAVLRPTEARVVAFDGDEPFPLEAVEAAFYELVTANSDELLALERGRYRLLRRAADFQLLPR